MVTSLDQLEFYSQYTFSLAIPNPLPIAFVAVQLYVPASLNSAFLIIIFPNIWSRRFASGKVSFTLSHVIVGVGTDSDIQLIPASSPTTTSTTSRTTRTTGFSAKNLKMF